MSDVELTLAHDGETLHTGDIVCFAVPADSYEESALLFVKELRGSRILVADQSDILEFHKPGYIVPTRALFARDVLKVA